MTTITYKLFKLRIWFIVLWGDIMELIPGVTKEDYSDYVLYYIENFSDELKSEIRSRLVSICHGAEHAQSTRVIYSYCLN